MSLMHLPDDLLVIVFGHLSLDERHRSLPLVSRRCWQLLCHPQLLHTVEVSISGSNNEAMPRLRSLAHFLLQRGVGSVRQLRLDLGDEVGADDDSATECLALVTCTAAACSGLEQLEVSMLPTATLSTWLLPLGRSLRRLKTTGMQTCTVVAGCLSSMTALQELELSLTSEYVAFADDARLPTSLTRLALANGSAFERMPAQIGALPNLRHLHILHPYHDADSYAPLTRLSLHTLKLTGCVRMVPACLSALTSLQSLTVEGGDLEDEEDAVVAAGLAAALPHLQQLVRLDVVLSLPEPLAALTALTSLRWLSIGDEPEDGSALPPGDWLRQLQTLAAPQSLVARSLPALRAAPSLEQLCMYANHGSTDSQLSAIIGWAARHPSLQQLLLGNRPLSSCLWGEIAAASRARPTLCIVPGTIEHPDLD